MARKPIKPNPTIPFNREDLAWAAGFLDGEGSFTAYTDEKRSKCQLSITAPQVNRQPLDRLASIIGGSVSGPQLKSKSGFVSSNKIQHRWSISSFEQSQAVIALLWCWMSDPKRKQAEQALLKVRNFYSTGKVLPASQRIGKNHPRWKGGPSL